MRLILTTLLMSTLSISLYTPAQAHHRAAPFTATYFSGQDSVEFKDLSCVLKNSRVELSWSIGNNESADRLIVQRSLDGKNFEMAGLVFGTDKNSLDQYRFFESVRSRTAYYRIIVVSKDKSVVYSPVVRLASENER